MAEFENYLVAASVIMVAIGWFIQHHLDRRNERLNRHEEIRIRFLIESYGMLNYFLHKGVESKSDALKFQGTMNTIFLLGRRDLVEAVKAFNAFDKADGGPGGTIGIGDIVGQLRKQVRDELSLDFRDKDPNRMRISGAYEDGIVGDAGAHDRLTGLIENTSTAKGA